MLLPPLQSQPFAGLKVLVAPANQHARIADRPLAKPSLHVGCVSHHMQFVEPVDDLTVAAVEPRRPGAGGPFSLLDKQAIRPSVLELHEGVRLARPVTNGEIAAEVPENRILPGETVERTQG